jgi:hypothetical protein
MPICAPPPAACLRLKWQPPSQQLQPSCWDLLLRVLMVRGRFTGPTEERVESVAELPGTRGNQFQEMSQIPPSRTCLVLNSQHEDHLSLLEFSRNLIDSIREVVRIEVHCH